MRRWLDHPWVRLAARLALGLTFAWAAFSKLQDPPAFAKAIWAYGLVPAWALNPLALVLPWLELLCGLALLLGRWIRPAAAWTGLMLLAFCLAIGLNLARHRPVDCGCFGGGPAKTDAERLADMRGVLARDLLLLALALRLVLPGPASKETRHG